MIDAERTLKRFPVAGSPGESPECVPLIVPATAAAPSPTMIFVGWMRKSGEKA